MIDCALALWYTGITTQTTYGAFCFPTFAAGFSQVVSCGQSAPLYGNRPGRLCGNSGNREGRFAIMIPIICLHCGKSFSGMDFRHECCSWECFDARFIKSKYFEKIQCSVCGKTIVKCGPRKYCSDKCKLSVPKRGNISAAMKERIFRRDNWKCVYCGERADCIDHVIPFSKCKHNEEWNLVSACTSCNLKVKDRCFQSFDEKKRWILDARNVQEKKTHKDWHARVYGGWGRGKR